MQLAQLLLVTSNSMDGLIDQARTQLWKIVNEIGVGLIRNGRGVLPAALRASKGVNGCRNLGEFDPTAR